MESPPGAVTYNSTWKEQSTILYVRLTHVHKAQVVLLVVLDEERRLSGVPRLALAAQGTPCGRWCDVIVFEVVGVVGLVEVPSQVVGGLICLRGYQDLDILLVVGKVLVDGNLEAIKSIIGIRHLGTGH